MTKSDLKSNLQKLPLPYRLGKDYITSGWIDFSPENYETLKELSGEMEEGTNLRVSKELGKFNLTVKI